MYLAATNVWLERLLHQERSDEVGEFLKQRPSNSLFITDFALHSIGLILTRLGSRKLFRSFVEDLFIEGAVTLVRLGMQDLIDLIDVTERFSLDFDDAYQYVAAVQRNLIVVSFDSDFDRTELERKTPAQTIS